MSSSEQPTEGFNPHSPPGAYVLFDNLDSKNRLTMNVWTVYDPDSVAEGLYMKYLYINCKGFELCINLWSMDFIKITENLNLDIEWDATKNLFTFDDALSRRKIKFNGFEGTYFDFIESLNYNKNLRNILFSSGDVKLLSTKEYNNTPFEYKHLLVVDENRPLSDGKWDHSDNVRLRFRIELNIKISETMSFKVLFDRGARGITSIVPIGWYPSKKMDGILISQLKAYPIPHFDYVKKV